MIRTPLRRSLAGFTGLAALAGLCTLGLMGLGTLGIVACGALPNQIDVSGYPPEMQARYSLFERRCTRCHELERPLNADVSEGGWQRYVRRMARHPAAGISAAEQREIATFLEYHAQRQREAAHQARPAGGGP